jgi:hypothetical protein
MTNENPSNIQFFPVNFTGSQTDLRRTLPEKGMHRLITYYDQKESRHMENELQVV